MSNPPFFSDVDRGVPCTMQSDSVTQAIIALFAGVPALLYLLTAVMLLTFPITQDVQQEIKDANDRRQLGLLTVDPLTFKDIKSPLKDDLLLGTFSTAEVRAISRGQSWSRWLQAFILKTTCSSCFLVVCAVCLLAVIPRSLMALGMAGELIILMSLGWNFAKAATLYYSYHTIKYALQSHKEHQMTVQKSNTSTLVPARVIGALIQWRSRTWQRLKMK